MDFGLNGQLIPDIVYGYITKRDGYDRSRGFLTPQGFVEIPEDRKNLWLPITKRCSLNIISIAFDLCVEIYKTTLPQTNFEQDLLDTLKQLFDLEEWKTCQCIPTSVQNVTTL